MSGRRYVYVASHGSDVVHVKRADGSTVCGRPVTGRWQAHESGSLGEALPRHPGQHVRLCRECDRMRDASSMILATPSPQASLRFASVEVEGSADDVKQVLDSLRGPYVPGEGS